MTDLLINLFIKDNKNVQNKKVREKHGTLSSIVGIIINILISATKLIIGLVSASVALVADALNNLSDAASSIITMLSFKLSGKPADRDHPFGHARIEYIASMIVSFLILIVGFEMITSSISAIFNPDYKRKIEFTTVSLIIVGASVLFKLWLGIFNRKVGKKINSSVILATSTDCFMDCISTTAVLLSSIIVKISGFALIDALMGILVSILIFVAGIKILNETKNSLLGEAPSKEIKENIEKIISEFPDVVGTHDLIIHNYGPNNYLVSFHAEVDGSKDIFLLHDAIDNLEREIAQRLDIICTIHLDPIITDDALINEKKALVSEIVTELLGENSSMHDFRLVKGDTHTNMIFDVMLPYESKLTPKEAVTLIQNTVSKRLDNHFCVITVDRG